MLETDARKSRYRQHGERVVQGQRMMQAASDIFLGWTRGIGPDVRRHVRLELGPSARPVWGRCRDGRIPR